MIDRKPLPGVPLVLRRKGFTLIELLVVIGIIALLAAILIVGVKSISKSSHEKATRTNMENLKSLVVELTNSGAMDKIYNMYKYNPTPPPNYPYGQPLPTPFNPGGAAVAIPGNVQKDSPDRLPAFTTSAPPYIPKNEVARTQLVMGMLNSVASAMIQKLPSGTFMSAAEANSAAKLKTPMPVTVPLDGWGNPMIFVPGGGIRVTVTGTNKTVVTQTITAPDGKGFWASAGPDGIFTDTINSSPNQKPNGDDNVYSFEN
jgi:prepilin-type N-terminal cleavage/methylation domain-containing protein